MPGPRFTQFMTVETQLDLPLTGVDGDICYCKDVRASFIFDGTNWLPSSRSIVKISTVTVNLTAAGTTQIYMLEPSALKFYPLQVIPRAITKSNVAIGPSLSLGANATSYNDIASTSLLNTILAALTVGTGRPQLVETSPALSGNTPIFVKVVTPATGIGVVYTAKFDLVGYYAQ